MLKACLLYAIVLCKSIADKKNFTQLGKIAQVSADMMSRRIAILTDGIATLETIAVKTFSALPRLYVVIDTTMIRKMFSEHIEGTRPIFDNKLGIPFTGFNLFTVGVSDGRIFLPIFGDFAEKNDTVHHEKRIDSLFKKAVLRIKTLFPHTTIIVTADGFFATTALLSWCVENSIMYEGRIHNNRVVTYQGQQQCISEIKTLLPKGKQK